jgi:hypothetical protein
MEALTNSTPLSRPLQLKNGQTLYTVSDAAMFIRKLRKRSDALHWTLAGSAITEATKAPSTDSLSHATRAMWNALDTDGLVENVGR